MFCPKCGSQLPDNAAFCGKCGNPVATGESRPTASTPQHQSKAVEAAGRMSSSTIGALVATIITVVCMFLPWVKDSNLKQLGSYGSYVGVNVQDSFSVFNVGDLFSVYGSYRDASIFATVMILIWAAVLIMLVVGAVLTVRDKKPAVLLIVGGLLAAVAAIAWCFMFMVVAQRPEISATAPAFLTIVLGIVVAIAGAAGRKSGTML